MIHPSIVLMAHRDRRDMVVELMDELDEAGPTVVWDEKGSRWDTMRRCLLAGDREASHVVVVQDDAVLCSDFVPRSRACLEWAHKIPVSFYLGELQPHTPEIVEYAIRKAEELDTPWVQMEGPWWTVAVAVPTAHIDALVAHGDQSAMPDHDDMRMTKYFNQVPLPTLYTVPSLADHRPGPSLSPGRKPDRHAKRWPAKGVQHWTADPVVVHGPAEGVRSQMMAFVIVDGQGTYSVLGRRFKPGANPVPDDDPALDYIKENAPKWVTVQEDRKAEAPPEPAPEPKPAPPAKLEPYQSREDDKWYFIHHISGQPKGPWETEADAARAAQEEETSIPLAQDLAKKTGGDGGTFTTQDLPENNQGYACPDCGKELKSSAGRDNHRRIKHPEAFKADRDGD